MESWSFLQEIEPGLNHIQSIPPVIGAYFDDE